ncbi:hypothetical protein AB6F64_02135 [Providencia hangzhouensis]|uniref:MotA/TolQ/ExbB proton channel domain-containing protein n=1 Tax=Providencia rettgeri TaxID=587 RepID=A0AAJ4NMP2_PRORE|nr:MULTISPECIES: hypothetical protein [Providencia]MCF8965057.1 hypothetical protein [Providencia rettgeri]QWQ18715.2 hypothetical protein KOL65_02175 [Providencia rettgeri]QWQ22549.2 hypothetical protein KOF27_02175 [Providencia rettgeri]QWQ26385.2 hypothetical protein KOL64_02175 [Providencia rettgeri]UDQ67737.1 hypothetical protein LHK11_02140 [Providencia rettgeri]
MNIAQVGIHAFIGITNNMYYLGLFFYAATFLACFLLQSVREMVQQCLLLAPEISYTMIGIYIYPLVIFLFHRLFNKNKKSNYTLLSNQTKLSASVTVSLGLIGTFIGLTGMITAISASLGGEGDVSEKMNAMISSISMALNSMSFAFLTSILGVSISVLLLVSLNFFHFFYQKENKKTQQQSANYSEELNHIQETLNTLQKVNINIAQKMISVTENNELATDISSHLLALSSTAQEHLEVLQSIKEADYDWKRKLAVYLLEEKINKNNQNEKISEEILKIDQTTQWLKENTIESRKKLLTLLSME